jgi:hypothetical protein
LQRSNPGSKKTLSRIGKQGEAAHIGCDNLLVGPAARVDFSRSGSFWDGLPHSLTRCLP